MPPAPLIIEWGTPRLTQTGSSRRNTDAERTIGPWHLLVPPQRTPAPRPFARVIWPITHWGTDRRQVIAPGDHRAAPPSITRTPEAVRQPKDQPGGHLPPGGAPRHRPGRTEDTDPRFPDQRVHTLEIIKGTSNTLRRSGVTVGPIPRNSPQRKRGAALARFQAAACAFVLFLVDRMARTTKTAHTQADCVIFKRYSASENLIIRGLTGTGPQRKPRHERRHPLLMSGRTRRARGLDTCGEDFHPCRTALHHRLSLPDGMRIQYPRSNHGRPLLS